MKILILLILLVLVVFPEKAVANEFILRLSPPLIQIRLDPPANVNTPISIENLGDETLILDVILKPFTAGEARHRLAPGEKENGEVAYFWNQEDFSKIGENPLFFDNVSVVENGIEINRITLAPKQEKTISLKIDISKDESASDYYFSIIFISKNSEEAQLSHSQIQSGIATNILLSIGRENPSVKLLEFSTPLLADSEPIPFTIGLQNNGKHFVSANAHIEIKNILGQTVDNLEFQNINVLAEKSRSQNYIWENNPFIGPYTATLKLSIDQNSPAIIQTTGFFVIPVKLIIGLGILLIIVFLIGRRLKKGK